MHNIVNILKAKMNIFIFMSIIFIGLIITFTNLSINFGLSFSSKNQRAIIAKDNLSKFPEGLLLISTKNQNEFTIDDTLTIKEWLDKERKSESEINIYENDKATINLNYMNNFDLAKYLNKLFLIPNVEIKSLIIFNNKKQIKINLLFN
tara:strand:+ start:596 stop:1042 length:447 start_codon:yes stop_codon:yes gene_type:complete